MRAYWQRVQGAATAGEAGAVVREGWLKGGAGALVADGLLLLRQYELNGSVLDAARGRRAVERAVREAPQSAWAHFALGVVLARGPDVRVRTASGTYFVDPHSNAAQQAPRALQRALELDPTLIEAAQELGSLALDLNRGDLLASADHALDRVDSAARSDVLLLRARIAERLDAPERGAMLADSARARGADASVAAHERARNLFRVREREQEALAAYLSGIDRLTEAGAELYFRALEPILDVVEVAEWQSLDGAARGRWLRDYWEHSAALAGVSVQERVSAHYRRLYEARVLFPLVHVLGSESGAAEIVDPRVFGLTIPGLLHVRHGDAARITRFSRCGSAIDTVPPLLRPAIPECRVPVEMGGLEGWQVGLSAAEKRLRLRQMRERALQGESYHPPFQRDVPVALELYSFRGAGGLTELVAAVAAPAAALQPEQSNRPLAAEVDFIVIDRATRRVWRDEGVRTPVLPTAAGDVIWTTSLTVDAGEKAVRVSVSDTLRRAGRVARADVVVRSFATDSTALSDLVLAPRAGAPTWSRGDVALALAPQRDYVRAERFELYYEVYGLAADAPYRTEIILAPDIAGVWERVRSALGMMPDVVRLRFDERAVRPHEQFGVQQVRTIDASALSAGTYRLRVAVTDLRSGRITTTERLVSIR